jgi:uncharacterized protein
MTHMTQDALGSVVSVRRYPVKSMMGEELNAADLTEVGLLGDRAYALIDTSTGKIASAKNPRKWARLFDFHAAYVESPRRGKDIPPVRITLPDGAEVLSNQRDINEILSSALGRDVVLRASAPEAPSLEEYWPDLEGLAHRETVTDEGMPAKTFFDLAVIHVLTTATINQLRELYPQGRFEVRRFRPNIVVQPAAPENGFVENDWINRMLAIGDEARLSISGPCPRCVMTTLPQGDLPKDVGILRTAAQHNHVNVGVYANVAHGGTIRRGDAVRLV